jgi:hypothetical protein
MRNNTGPRVKRSKLEMRMNREIIWCVALLFVMCITCALGTGIWDTLRDLENTLYLPSVFVASLFACCCRSVNAVVQQVSKRRSGAGHGCVHPLLVFVVFCGSFYAS